MLVKAVYLNKNIANTVILRNMIIIYMKYPLSILIYLKT